ncbi:MAG: AAA family ATPase [Chloroflexia bacterium]|nr:AAA family ATPase [Chloroflexia bacterium]
MKALTPRELVKELDCSIIGQERAKRDLAVAIRNRWRSQQARLCSEEDIAGHRYLLTGPRGAGKSALVRRAAQAIDAPYAHVSALRLAGPGAQEKAAGELLESLIESVRPRVASQETAVANVRMSAIISIDDIDRLFPSGLSEDNRDERLEAAQQAFYRLLSAPAVHTRHGEIPTANVLIVAASQTPASRLADQWPDLQALFPRRIELDNLTDDDLLHILSNGMSSPVQHYIALMASEGLTLHFAPEGLEAIAFEAGEQNRKSEDIGARRLAMVIEGVLDELLFDPAGAAQTDVMIDAGYVAARITVDGDDDDLADFIL